MYSIEWLLYTFNWVNAHGSSKYQSMMEMHSDEVSLFVFIVLNGEAPSWLCIPQFRVMQTMSSEFLLLGHSLCHSEMKCLYETPAIQMPWRSYFDPLSWGASVTHNTWRTDRKEDYIYWETLEGFWANQYLWFTFQLNNSFSHSIS